MNANELATRLAVIKAAKTILDQEEKATKAAILDVLGPGDRKRANVAGANVGTITIADTTPGLRVVAPAAFLAWCREHHPDAVQEVVRDSDKRAILAQATKTGELPDGVDLGAERAPTVTVRMTPEQETALGEAFTRGEVSLGDVLAIGGPR